MIPLSCITSRKHLLTPLIERSNALIVCKRSPNFYKPATQMFLNVTVCPTVSACLCEEAEESILCLSLVEITPPRHRGPITVQTFPDALTSQCTNYWSHYRYKKVVLLECFCRVTARQLVFSPEVISCITSFFDAVSCSRDNSFNQCNIQMAVFPGNDEVNWNFLVTALIGLKNVSIISYATVGYFSSFCLFSYSKLL